MLAWAGSLWAGVLGGSGGRACDWVEGLTETEVTVLTLVREVSECRGDIGGEVCSVEGGDGGGEGGRLWCCAIAGGMAERVMRKGWGGQELGMMGTVRVDGGG